MTEFPKHAGTLVIGGGVIGLAVARELAKRGARGVLLIDRGSLGQESSSAAAGMLAPQAEANEADEFFQLCRQSRDLYSSFAASLLEETGTDVELSTAGTLYLAFNEHDANELEQRYTWQTQSGLPVERLERDEATYFEPAINPETLFALRFPLDTQVENRRLLSALAVANERLGVRLGSGVEARSLQLRSGHVMGVETSEGLISTERVVIAGGAWSSQLPIVEPDHTAAPELRMEPVRGQMLCFEANPQIVEHVIYSARGYIVPRRDGRLLAGSTSERAGFDKRVTAAGIQSITAAALEICPRIGKLPLTSSWAGLRPRAADGLPVLGPCAEIEGVFYATGHYRNGILLAPITAELLADAIIEGTVSPQLQTFSPDRFNAPVLN